MQRWTSPLRLFGFKHSLQTACCTRDICAQWKSAVPPVRSYSTALGEDQRDDNSSTPPVSSLDSLNEERSSLYPQEYERRARFAEHNSQKSAQTRKAAPKNAAPLTSRRQLAGKRRLKAVDNAVVRLRLLAPKNVAPVTSRKRLSRKRRAKVVYNKTPLRWRLMAPYTKSFIAARLLRKRKKQSQSVRQSQRSAPDLKLLHAKKHFVTNLLPIAKTIPANGWLESQWRPILDVRAIEWTARILRQIESGHRTLSVGDLSLADDKDPIVIWKQVALWLLSNDKAQMIQFLLATRVEAHIPKMLVEDSLLLLAMYWSNSPDSNSAYYLQELADAFILLADRQGDAQLAFFNPFIRILIRFSRDEQIHRMYEAIERHRVSTAYSTYLHFATHFAKLGHIERAFEALLRARGMGSPLDTYGFRSVCATLLRKSSEQPDGLRVCLSIVSRLVEIGVELNKPIFDIIMLNAVEAGDLKTTFSVYHTMVERGLQPTTYTFAILLKGCKLNIDDAEMLNETIRNAVAHVNVRQSEVVASEILHCLALHHSKHNPTTAFNTLLEAYSQLFDTGPLQELGISIGVVSQTRLPSPEPAMLPTQHALNIILGAKIRHTLAHDPNLQPLLHLYEQWRTHVKAGHPQLANLATTDYTANIFLKAFTRKQNWLVHAARVIRDMQQHLPDSAGVEQILPTVQSWSILMHGFTRHGKVKLAEQILNYMRSKGVEPNAVTWNTLVTGYARLQDQEGTIEALRRAEEGGLIWNEWTYGGLKALRDRRRLREVLEKGRLSQQLDFSAELKQGLGARLLESKEPMAEMTLDEDSTDTSSHSEVDANGVSSADAAEQTTFQPF